MPGRRNGARHDEGLGARSGPAQSGVALTASRPHRTSAHTGILAGQAADLTCALAGVASRQPPEVVTLSPGRSVIVGLPCPWANSFVSRQIPDAPSSRSTSGQMFQEHSPDSVHGLRKIGARRAARDAQVRCSAILCSGWGREGARCTKTANSCLMRPKEIPHRYPGCGMKN